MSAVNKVAFDFMMDVKHHQENQIDPDGVFEVFKKAVNSRYTNVLDLQGLSQYKDSLIVLKDRFDERYQEISRGRFQDKLDNRNKSQEVKTEILRVEKRMRALSFFSEEQTRFLTILHAINSLVQQGEEVDWSRRQGFARNDEAFFKNNFRGMILDKNFIAKAKEALKPDSDFELDVLLEAGEEIGVGGIQLAVDLHKPNSLYTNDLLDRAVITFTIVKGIREGDSEYELSEKEKFTLGELSLLFQIDLFAEEFLELRELDVFAEETQQIVEKLQIIKDQVDDFKGAIDELINLPAGTIGLKDVYKWVETRGKSKLSYGEALQVWATWSDYGHAGITYRKKASDNIEKSSTQYAHVMGEFVNGDLELNEMLSTDFYALEWEKLVTEEGQIFLQDELGPQWKDRVQNMYQDVCEDFLKNEQNFQGVTNPNYRRMRSVLKSSTTKNPHEIENLNFKNRETFCSEFVALALSATLHQLEERLKKESDEIEFVTHSINIFRDPFTNGKFQNPESMHPGRLEREIRSFTQPKPVPRLLTDLIREKRV